MIRAQRPTYGVPQAYLPMPRSRAARRREDLLPPGRETPRCLLRLASFVAFSLAHYLPRSWVDDADISVPGCGGY